MVEFYQKLVDNLYKKNYAVLYRPFFPFPLVNIYNTFIACNCNVWYKRKVCCLIWSVLFAYKSIHLTRPRCVECIVLRNYRVYKRVKSGTWIKFSKARHFYRITRTFGVYLTHLPLLTRLESVLCIISTHFVTHFDLQWMFMKPWTFGFERFRRTRINNAPID